MAKENKIRDKKVQSVRLDDEETSYLFVKGRNRSFNESVKNVILAMRSLEAQGLAEIRGYFTPEEWLYMAYVIKMCDITYDKNVLILKLTDTKNTIALVQMYSINIGELTSKIAELSPHHVFALVERINAFWVWNGADAREWAKF